MILILHMIYFLFSTTTTYGSSSGGFIIGNLTPNETAWNTTLSPNITSFPTLVTRNIGWFFPLITLVLLLISDYLIATKRGVSLKNNFYTVALAYTMLSYVEVAGSLSTTGYFFIFEFIMIGALILTTLFIRQGQQ